MLDKNVKTCKHSSAIKFEPHNNSSLGFATFCLHEGPVSEQGQNMWGRGLGKCT